ncbi:hypothetical protein JKP88DRAFT_298901 [Tribonema minus]|uniref:Uncharacterized protein n=1 Tax=Tribonema minus TaxID=303371 RepID=A0A835ZB01_9STRA|nr:hypothetical protein JKP88DRAFT_298901 [Tribonema minus]
MACLARKRPGLLLRYALCVSAVMLLRSPAATAATPSCTTGAELVKVGNTTAVCLIVNPLDYDTATNYSQISIFPAADSFSRFVIPGSWSAEYAASGTQTDPLLQKYGKDVAFHVESNGVASFQKSFRQASLGITFPLFTAIINVDRGNITSITWDDGCHFCARQFCQANTFNFAGTNTTADGQALGGKDCYYEDAKSCVNASGQVSDACQLEVYVVWSGTDRDGIFFQSQQKRLGLFAGPTVGQYLKTAEGTFNNAYDRLT